MASYPSLDEAAAAAMYLAQRQEKAREREWMALIFQDPETAQYLLSDFQSSGRQEGVSYTGPKLGDVAGIVHNHPLPQHSSHRPGFSDMDIRAADQLGVPSYVVEMRDGSSIVYEPGVTRKRINRRSARSGEQFAAGDPFLGPIPIDVIRAELMARLGRAPDDPRGPYLETPPAGLLSAAGPGLLSD